MHYIGISKDNNHFKGNLHSHTTHSDGHFTPQQAKDAYKAQGYDFLVMTDHDIYLDYRATLNDNDFIVVPGLEASAYLLAPQEASATPYDITAPIKPKCLKTHHFLGILGTQAMQDAATQPMLCHEQKIAPPVFYGQWDGAGVAQQVVDDLRARGMLVSYNHPCWSRVDKHEYAGLQGIFGLEVYNYGTEIECALGDATACWDAMLRKGIQMPGFASDDNHNSDALPDSFGGAVVVQAEHLTHDAIVQALANGNFYATSGVDIIEWGIRDNIAYVTCSPARQIDFIVGGNVGDGCSVYCQNKDDTVSYAEYTLKGSETYLRIQCTDQYGRKAWTNPYYFTSSNGR